MLRFLLGQAGRQSDGGVLSNSCFGEALEEGLFLRELHSQVRKLRKSHVILDLFFIFLFFCFIEGTTGPSLPYVIVGDEAFTRKENTKRPFPGR